MKKHSIIISILVVYSLFSSYKVYTLQSNYDKLLAKHSKSEKEINTLINKLADTINELSEYKNKSALSDGLKESEKRFFLDNEDVLNKEIQKLKTELATSESLQKSASKYINASKPFTIWTDKTYKHYSNLASNSPLLKKKISTRDLINLAQTNYKNFNIQDDIYNARCDDTVVNIYYNANIRDQSELAITNCHLEKDFYEYPLVYKLNKEKIYPIVNLNDYSFMYESGEVFNVSDLNNDGNFELWLRGDVCECDDPDEKDCDCNGISVVEESEGVAFLRH